MLLPFYLPFFCVLRHLPRYMPICIPMSVLHACVSVRLSRCLPRLGFCPWPTDACINASHEAAGVYPESQRGAGANKCPSGQRSARVRVSQRCAHARTSPCAAIAVLAFVCACLFVHVPVFLSRRQFLGVNPSPRKTVFAFQPDHVYSAKLTVNTRVIIATEF